MPRDRRDSEEEEQVTFTGVLESVGWFVLQAAGVAGTIIGGVGLGVKALGFTDSGVAAGSLAATYQSKKLGGTIERGSTFSELQSVGAKGLSASTMKKIAAGSVVATSAYHCLNKK